jgi:hypothetical protein
MDRHAEWEVLEAVCAGVDSADKADRLRELLAMPGFSLGELLDQALRHRILALLVDTVESWDLWQTFPPRMVAQLETFKAANTRRNRILTARAVEAAAALEAEGITVACTKGVVFQFVLYDRPGGRLFGDVDMMILPTDVDATRRVMTGLGYQIGDYHQPSNSIRDISRERKVMYRMSPDHLPHFLLVLDDEVVPFAAVDFAFSMTWADAAWQVPMGQVLAERDRLTLPGGGSIPTLTAPYSFVFAVLHLFREGWLERTVVSKDVTLSTFADVHRFWARDGARLAAPVRAIVDEHALHDPVRWVTGHVDGLFGTSITPALGLAPTSADPWLSTARSTRGTQITWCGTMRDRLRGKGVVEFRREDQPGTAQ